MVVTRADVAAMAGVSPAVVSYVLNPGGRPVSVAARARVEDAIKTLGYRPNAIAQALRRSSTMSIGLMVPDLANPAIAAVAHELEDIAYDLGYVMFLGTIGSDPAREQRYLRTYVDRQVDALILIGSHRPGLVTEIAGNGLPVIILDKVPTDLGLSSVVPDAFASSDAIVRHLIEDHGHTRIACITGPKDGTGISADRVAGWRHALDEADLSSDESLIYYADAVTRASGHTATKLMLDSALPADSRPTAFFTSADVQAVGVIGAVRELGLFVPGDVAVVSWDASELAARAFPGLTSVGPDPAEVARLTMQRLISKLTTPSSTTKPDRKTIESASAAGLRHPHVSAAMPPNLDRWAETHDVVATTVTYRRSCGCGTVVQ